jgi:hypothetical protein
VIFAPSTARTTRSSVSVSSRVVPRSVRSSTSARSSRLQLAVEVTITRSPTRQPVTASDRVTSVAPGFAGAPSFTQVRLSGAPCKSIRPPQHTIAGHDSRSMPSK